MPLTIIRDKVFLLLQVTFGNIILEDIAKKTELTSPIQTLMAIYNHAPRIVKGNETHCLCLVLISKEAIVQFTLNREYGIAARSALELHRVVVGKAWEDLPTVFRQIPSIGLFLWRINRSPVDQVQAQSPFEL